MRKAGGGGPLTSMGACSCLIAHQRCGPHEGEVRWARGRGWWWLGAGSNWEMEDTPLGSPNVANSALEFVPQTLRHRDESSSPGKGKLGRVSFNT